MKSLKDQVIRNHTMIKVNAIAGLLVVLGLALLVKIIYEHEQEIMLLKEQLNLS